MELPATTEFFSKNKQGKLGLRTDCKKCNKLRANAHYEVNKKLISSKQKAYYQKNKEKIAIVHKAHRDSHKEEIKAHRDSHKEETKAYNKAYRQSHKEDMKAYAKAYAKAYNESHKEEIAVYAKAYYQRPEVKEKTKDETIVVPAEEGQVKEPEPLPSRESLIKEIETKLIASINMDNKEMDEKEQYTYIIKDNHSGYYKIGRSKDPYKRLKAVCPTYSSGVVILIINSDLELMLHKHFDNKRVKGEWFNLDLYDLEWIKEHI